MSTINANNFNRSISESVTRPGANSWNINVLRFPSDLGSGHLQHYITFSINVRGKTSYEKNKQLFQINKENSAGLSANELGKAVDAAKVLVGAGIGSMITGKVKNALPAAIGSGGRAADTVVGVGGAVVGGTIASVISLGDLLKPDNSYRISDVIALHIEDKPTVSYSAEYANKDLGTLAGILGQVSGSDFASTINNAINMGGEVAQAAVLGLAKLPSMFGATDVKSLISASAKVNLNPFREVIFEAIDFRSFNFKFRLMPRSKKESDTIRNIINTFEFHMHPELSDNKLFFIYPAEFQINYFYKSSLNEYFHAFRPCVLKNMQIDYGGEQFTSFDTGAPTEINLALSFQETQINTKEFFRPKPVTPIAGASSSPVAQFDQSTGERVETGGVSLLGA